MAAPCVALFLTAPLCAVAQDAPSPPIVGPARASALQVQTNATNLATADSTRENKLTIPPVFPPTDNIRMASDASGWKCANADSDSAAAIAEYIRPPDSLDNWTEMVTILHLKDIEMTVEQFVGMQQETLLEQSPSTKWTTQKISSDSALFEWHHPQEGGEDAQYEIARVIQRPSGIYRFSFVVKNDNPAAALIQTWRSILSSVDVSKK